MTDTFDLFGAPTPLKLPLPAGARTALELEGITPPEYVLLLLRQATPREVQWLAAAQLNPPQSEGEAKSWLESLIRRRRAEDTDIRVVRELIKDITPDGITRLTFVFTEGRTPDPKETALLRERLLATFAASRPAPGRSSPTSTASTSKPQRPHAGLHPGFSHRVRLGDVFARPRRVGLPLRQARQGRLEGTRQCQSRRAGRPGDAPGAAALLRGLRPAGVRQPGDAARRP